MADLSQADRRKKALQSIRLLNLGAQQQNGSQHSDDLEKEPMTKSNDDREVFKQKFSVLRRPAYKPQAQVDIDLEKPIIKKSILLKNRGVITVNSDSPPVDPNRNSEIQLTNKEEHIMDYSNITRDKKNLTSKDAKANNMEAKADKALKASKLVHSKSKDKSAAVRVNYANVVQDPPKNKKAKDTTENDQENKRNDTPMDLSSRIFQYLHKGKKPIGKKPSEERTNDSVVKKGENAKNAGKAQESKAANPKGEAFKNQESDLKNDGVDLDKVDVEKPGVKTDSVKANNASRSSRVAIMSKLFDTKETEVKVAASENKQKNDSTGDSIRMAGNTKGNRIRHTLLGLFSTNKKQGSPKINIDLEQKVNTNIESGSTTIQNEVKNLADTSDDKIQEERANKDVDDFFQSTSNKKFKHRGEKSDDKEDGDDSKTDSVSREKCQTYMQQIKGIEQNLEEKTAQTNAPTKAQNSTNLVSNSKKGKTEAESEDVKNKKTAATVGEESESKNKPSGTNKMQFRDIVAAVIPEIFEDKKPPSNENLNLNEKNVKAAKAQKDLTNDQKRGSNVDKKEPMVEDTNISSNTKQALLSNGEKTDKVEKEGSNEQAVVSKNLVNKNLVKSNNLPSESGSKNKEEQKMDSSKSLSNSIIYPNNGAESFSDAAEAGQLPMNKGGKESQELLKRNNSLTLNYISTNYAKMGDLPKTYYKIKWIRGVSGATILIDKKGLYRLQTYENYIKKKNTQRTPENHGNMSHYQKYLQPNLITTPAERMRKGYTNYNYDYERKL